MIEESWAQIEAVVQGLPLPEQQKVLGRLSEYVLERVRSLESPDERIRQSRAARQETVAILKGIPARPTDDPRVSENHDRYIYGEPS